MWPLFLWLITAVHVSGKPCCKAAGIHTPHMHGHFGGFVAPKRARGKKKTQQKHTSENKDPTVYFSRNEIRGVHNALSIFVGVCTHT